MSIAEPVEAVLFDALGTLVRLEPTAPRLRASLRSRFGLEVDVDRCHTAMRAEMRHYRAHCERARDDATLAALRLECADVLADALGEGLTGPELLPSLTDAIVFSLYDDAVPALDALAAAGIRVAIVSNWDVSLERTLERLGVRDRFPVVVHSAGVGASKPDGKPFAVALERLGVEASRAAHVGDDPRADVDGARAAGLRAVLVARDGPARDGVVQRLTDLPAALGVAVPAP